MPLPKSLAVNAWTGQPGPEGSPLSGSAGQWAVGRLPTHVLTLAPERLADLRDWRHPRVGWGLVLPERDDLPDAEKARAEDAPEAIQRLVRERGDAPVFRHRPTGTIGHLRRYFIDGSAQDTSLVGSPRGVARGHLPRYLLIYASPREISWSFQYRLQAVAFVGRLDLDPPGLDHYVEALLTDWQGGDRAAADKALVWAVDHGGTDITRLMRHAIAAKVASELAGDAELAAGTRYIDGSQGGASANALADSLAELRPALVVTTSHGMTGPLDDVPAMAAQLGSPVDENHAVADPEQLTASWSPAGAIWYSHACCSAGSASETAYDGLVEEDSSVDLVIRGVTAVGDLVAPLPRALLGAERPLRAFIGQVEPTFDWTLRQQHTGQLLTSSLVDALYQRLYQPGPVAWALEECHRHGPQLELLHQQAKTRFAAGDDSLGEMLAYRLMAQDRESLVILGDPTVGWIRAE